MLLYVKHQGRQTSTAEALDRIETRVPLEIYRVMLRGLDGVEMVRVGEEVLP